MTPAAPRVIGRNAICTAALWTNCRCPRCAPETEPPLDDPTGQLAAAPSAKADHVERSRDTGGGIFGVEP